jgi:hypothetical protein
MQSDTVLLAFENSRCQVCACHSIYWLLDVSEVEVVPESMLGALQEGRCSGRVQGAKRRRSAASCVQDGVYPAQQRTQQTYAGNAVLAKSSKEKGQLGG